MLHIFVLNLKYRVDRFENIQNVLKKHKITNFTRFDAIFYNWKNLPDSYLKAIKKPFLHRLLTNDTKINLGMLGTSQSHVSIWNLVKNQTYPCLILEDDIDICVENFSEKILDIIEKESDFDLIPLTLKPYQNKNIKKKYNDDFVEYQNPTFCSYGYIISPKFAKYLYEYNKYVSCPIDIHVQNILKNNSFKIISSKENFLETDISDSRDSDIICFNSDKISKTKIQINKKYIKNKPKYLKNVKFEFFQVDYKDEMCIKTYNKNGNGNLHIVCNSLKELKNFI